MLIQPIFRLFDIHPTYYVEDVVGFTLQPTLFNVSASCHWHSFEPTRANPNVRMIDSKDT